MIYPPRYQTMHFVLPVVSTCTHHDFQLSNHEIEMHFCLFPYLFCVLRARKSSTHKHRKRTEVKLGRCSQITYSLLTVSRVPLYLHIHLSIYQSIHPSTYLPLALRPSRRFLPTPDWIAIDTPWWENFSPSVSFGGIRVPAELRRSGPSALRGWLSLFSRARAPCRQQGRRMQTSSPPPAGRTCSGTRCPPTPFPQWPAYTPPACW